jgi:hypothetical protein
MDVQKTKVILVGNSTFPKWGGETKDIPNVEENIDSLKKIFIDKNYFGIPDAQTHLVEIKDATSQEILLRVKHETKSFAGKDQFERLIFYYSGHGIPGEDRKLFFASKDTVRRDYEITSVDSTRLFSYLEGFGAKELIVILDCCYAAQSKENLGDADTLITNSLPEDKLELKETENGAYYLFAAGKDNVAKFNPREPKQPTYFTEALLSSIHTGTEPGQDFITIGELYDQLRKQIAELRRNKNPDIPDPRPVLHGEVSGFLFCKNIKFEDQEEKDWQELKKDPTPEKADGFIDRYHGNRHKSKRYYEAIKLKVELIDIYDRLTEVTGKNEVTGKTGKKDVKGAQKIIDDFPNYPTIKDLASEFIRNQRAAEPERKSEIKSASSQGSSLTKDATGKASIESADNSPGEQKEIKPKIQNRRSAEVEWPDNMEPLKN